LASVEAKSSKSGLLGGLAHWGSSEALGNDRLEDVHIAKVSGVRIKVVLVVFSIGVGVEVNLA
jgi:hypothetical protein